MWESDLSVSLPFLMEKSTWSIELGMKWSTQFETEIQPYQSLRHTNFKGVKSYRKDKSTYM